MKSTPTPWTHTAVTAADFQTNSSGAGRVGYDVTVPAGTLCHKLDGGSATWVVADLSFITDKNSILYHDADHYGIRIPEDRLKDIYPVAVGMSREKIAAEVAALPAARKVEIDSAVQDGANEVDRTGKSTVAFLRGATSRSSIALSGIADLAYAEAAIAQLSRRQATEKTAVAPAKLSASGDTEVAYRFPNHGHDSTESIIRRLHQAGLTPKVTLDGGDVVIALPTDELPRLWKIQEMHAPTYGNAPSPDKQTLHSLLCGPDRAVLAVLRNGHSDTLDEFVEKKLVQLASTTYDPAASQSTIATARAELTELCALPLADLRKAMERYPDLALFNTMKQADYEARQLGADNKSGKEYRGTVVAITENHVVQSIGPTTVSHYKSVLSAIPVEGESVVIKYGKDHKANVTFRDDKDLKQSKALTR